MNTVLPPHVSIIIYSHLQAALICSERYTAPAPSFVRLYMVNYNLVTSPFYNVSIMRQGSVKIILK